MNERLVSLGALAVAASLIAGGCAAARRPYVAPTATTPAAWSETASGSTRDESVDLDALSRWWESFHDPVLTALVGRAVTSNLDVRTAVSRILEARASLSATRTKLQPTVDASGSPRISRSSAEAGSGEVGRLYQVGLDASWEVDVFGAVRSSIDSAAATVQSREADLQDVLVSLVADVATQYISLRSLQQRLAIAQANATTQEQTYDLTRFRAQAGLATDLDVQQALSNLESTRAQIALLESQASQTTHGLAVLLGQPPTSLTQELSGAADIPQASLSIAIGVPADTLRRRPDVRSAERQLAAQSAQTNVAGANLYPSVRLAGSIGLETLALARLLVPGATFWSASPTVNWRAFNRNQLRQDLIVQTEREQQAAVAFEARVLGALQEVEDTLVSMTKEQVRRDHLGSAAAAAQQAADLSLQLYSAGLRDFRDVLDAQRSLLVLQDQVATSTSSVSTDLVRLYRAVGGGWAAMP